MKQSTLISDLIAKHARAGFIQTPVIIHGLPRLSSHLGQNIYVLREDLTGFALGGNVLFIHTGGNAGLFY